VRQRADLYRFDVSVDADSCQHILGVLRRAKHRQGWWVREHIHYFRRLRRVMGLNVPGGAAMGANGEIRLFKVATWNIHSVVSKRQELEMYLQSTGVKLLALQETYRTLESWPIHLKNYQVFESVAAGGVGRAAAQNRQSQNGLALVIHRSLVAYEVGGSSPYVIVVRVMIGQLEWHILNIYLPPRGSLSRMAAIAEVKRAVASVFARDLDARMMILGDWNMEKDKLSSMFRRWRQPLGCIPCNGNPSTYHSGRRWTSIDHIVVTANVQSMMRRVRVNRGWDLSDHWPLESVVRAYSSVQPEPTQLPVGVRLDVSALAEKKEGILSHTIWDALLVEPDTEGDLAAELFETAVKQVVEDTEVERPPAGNGKEKPTYRLTPKAKMVIHQRRKAYRLWADREGPVRGGPLWLKYERFRVRANKLKREAARASWIRHVSQGAQHIAMDDMKSFWKWAKRIMHRGHSGPADSGPLYSKDDVLLYDSASKLDAWRQHYESLLGDPSGHSRDRDYWAQQFPGPANRELPGLNGPIRWGEVNRVLGKLRVGTAPGRDGIPPEFYKLAFESDVLPDFDGAPRSGLGRALLRILRMMWSQEVIPAQWNEAWVVSILKKGDPKRMGNYRGISLIVVMVKILTGVITLRLTEALESARWFIPQQAGFRTREECAGHICALVEIIQRRLLSGLRTFVAFIDIEKAYD
jgi:exonuclease III